MRKFAFILAVSMATERVTCTSNRHLDSLTLSGSFAQCSVFGAS